MTAADPTHQLVEALQAGRPHARPDRRRHQPGERHPDLPRHRRRRRLGLERDGPGHAAALPSRIRPTRGRGTASATRSVLAAQPNPAHRALVDLERWHAAPRRRASSSITQNIDLLHEAAGSRALIKVHGSIDRARCAGDVVSRVGDAPCRPRRSTSPPSTHGPTLRRCRAVAACGELMRPHVLWFDEHYGSHPDYGWPRCPRRLRRRCACVVAIGTSFSVGVTDLIAGEAGRRGVPLFVDRSAGRVDRRPRRRRPARQGRGAAAARLRAARSRRMTPPADDALLRFYRLEGADARGRTLAEIWSWDAARLEGVHDYIQWLFPLPEPSAFNPQAPILTEADDRGLPRRRRRCASACCRSLTADAGFLRAGAGAGRGRHAAHRAGAGLRREEPRLAAAPATTTTCA